MELILYALVLIGLGIVFSTDNSGNFVSFCSVGIRFSMESLILAQDERWRRA